MSKLGNPAQALRRRGDRGLDSLRETPGGESFSVGRVLITVLVLSVCAWLVLEPAVPDLLVDFRLNIWEPGRDVLEGENPFRNESSEGAVYPPAAFVATLPLSLLPYELAAPIWFAGIAGAFVIALWLCGVRDWRCVAVALLSPAAVFGFVYGNTSMLFVLGVVGLWLLRQRALGGVVLGLMIASKLFLFPLLAWLLFTRRYRQLIAAVGSCALFSLVGWLVVGFDTADDLISATRENVDRYIQDGSAIAALAAQAGLSAQLASLVAMFVGLCVLAFAWRSRTDDRYSFTLALVASICVSPLVWPHYYAIVLVPLALAYPVLSVAWFAPFVGLPQLDVGAKTLGALSGLLLAVAILSVVRRAQPALLGATHRYSSRAGGVRPSHAPHARPSTGMAARD